MFTDNTGQLFMSWVEQEGNDATLNYAVFDGSNWADPVTITTGTNWFLNWADFPSVIARDGKPMAAHWLKKIPGNTYSYNIEMSGYSNSWANSIIPHNDSTATEHGFVSMIPASDSSFAAVWLDGRNTAGRDHHEYSEIEKAMTLRGAFIQTNSEISEGFELDSDVCDCCNTSITKTEDGFIAAYRDRTADEIRDIYTVSYSNGNWHEPKRVHADNWQIAACPVNGPAIQSIGKNVAVAWFTGADSKGMVKISISEDNGESFNKPIILDQNNPTGRVDITTFDDQFWVSWVGKINESETILKIQSLSTNGEPVSSYTIPGISGSRSSGFPQLSHFKDGLLVAYTDISGNSPEVRTLFLN